MSTEALNTETAPLRDQRGPRSTSGLYGVGFSHPCCVETALVHSAGWRWIRGVRLGSAETVATAGGGDTGTTAGCVWEVDMAGTGAAERG